MYIYIYMVRRLAFPAPRPPQWYGLVGLRGGGGRVRTGMELLLLDVGLVLGRPGVTRKPYASHKPHKIAHAPVYINLNLYFKPYTQP